MRSRIQKTPADNERFSASGGVARPTVCADFGSLSPVRVAVKPPPAPSLQNVVRQRGTRQLSHHRRTLTYRSLTI